MKHLVLQRQLGTAAMLTHDGWRWHRDGFALQRSLGSSLCLCQISCISIRGAFVGAQHAQQPSVIDVVTGVIDVSCCLTMTMWSHEQHVLRKCMHEVCICLRWSIANLSGCAGLAAGLKHG
jgi:hypothetical protein